MDFDNMTEEEVEQSVTFLERRIKRIRKIKHNCKLSEGHKCILVEQQMRMVQFFKQEVLGHD